MLDESILISVNPYKNWMKNWIDVSEIEMKNKCGWKRDEIWTIMNENKQSLDENSIISDSMKKRNRHYFDFTKNTTILVHLANLHNFD